MSETTSPTTFFTRREALAAERAVQLREYATRPIVVRTNVLAAPSASSRGDRSSQRSPRAGVSRLRLTVFGSVATALLFATNATPALAADLAGNPDVAVTHATTLAQTYTSPGTVTIATGRDAYTVTAPQPVLAPRATIARFASLPVATADAATAPNTGTGDIRWPFPGTVPLSSTFGYRSAPCARCSSYHEGIDMLAGAGRPIGAVAGGTVRISGIDPNYGQYVVIDHLIDGRRISSLYGHMIYGSSPLHVGDQVAVGSLVGRVGSTGASTGAHLHLSILLDGTLPIDPRAWLEANAGRTL